MKITSLFVFMVLISSLSAQPWVERSPDQRADEELSFKEYQNAFNTYWKGKDIKNGYYYENGKKKKAYGWKQYKRWEHYWESKVDNQTGAFPSSRQYEEANSQFNQSAGRSDEGNWMSMGPVESPGGYAGVGRINHIAFHPNDSDVFWVTTPQGGVWRTMDGGNSWDVLTDSEEVLTTTAIAVSPDFTNTGIIYLGTGEMDSWQHDAGIGVLKSTDGGESWNETGLSFNAANGWSVNKILIHPDDYNIVFAATSNGIYKSYDGGDFWYHIYSEKYICDMEFKPGDPSIIYASNKYWGRIYTLSDDGYDIDVASNTYDDGARRIELAISPSSPSTIFALVAKSDGGLLNILKSTNSGSSYSTLYTPGPSMSKPNIMSGDKDGLDEDGQGWYDISLIVDPQNPNHIFCGGINTWESFNGGTSWILNNFWTSGFCSDCEIVHADKHFFAYNGNTLYECNDGGLYKTTDGVNWISISNGIVNSQIYKLGVSQNSMNKVLMGLQDNGTKYLNGDVWRDVQGGDGMECSIDYSNDNIQYCEIQNGGKLLRTTNSWYSKTDIKPLDSEGAWVTPFLIDPVNPSVIYAGYQHIYKSTDKGDNWDIIFNQNSESKFRSIAVAPSNTQVIYVSDQFSLWKTVNGGNSWTKLSNGLPDDMITYITFKNDDHNTVWLTFGGFNGNVVYQTTNGGNSWTNISAGLPHIPANTIVQNKMNTRQNELYLGTDFGVYLKKGASNWQFFNNGLPKVVVQELEIAYDKLGDSHRLRAATYGRGLWESDLITVNAPPVANFIANRTSISAGSGVQFTSISTNGPTSWEWEFEGGDPATSTEQHPFVTYNEVGTYDVTLSVSNAFGDDSFTKEDYIDVQCNVLNYFGSKAESVPGNYIDLGNNGSIINTASYDDKNSDPVDIGFDFYYNCRTYTQFILNTNGYIKLGDVPPSPSLFFLFSTGNDGGIFNSNEAEDVNLIIPFNHDLMGYTSPEYRVHTTGSAPNRVCTIQFEGLADKTTSPDRQYDDMEFQVKLYEETNVIEFIYGDWIASNNVSGYKAAACGLKGSGNSDENLLVVGKNSSQSWADPYFENSNYAPGAFALNFGNPPERPKPDRGRTYRFTPSLENDLSVGQIYALGKASLNNSNPQTIGVYVKNIGSRPAENLPVTLNITGANPFSDVTIVPLLESGQEMIVTFSPYSPTTLGVSDMSVTLPADDAPTDNSSYSSQETTQDRINYCGDDPPSSAFGYSAGFDGIFLSKYEIKGTAKIKSVDAFLINYSTNHGQRVYAVVCDEDGNIIAQSPDLTLGSTNMGDWHRFNIPNPPTITDANILVGLAVTKTNNGQAYYAMAVQPEIPNRLNTYYTSTLDGSNLTPRDGSFDLRYMLGVNAVLPTLEGEASADNENICIGNSTTIALSGSHSNVQWQESNNGISNWTDVTEGSGGNTQNYTTAILEYNRYYRAKVTDANQLVLYSNIVLISVHPEYQIFESYNICAGEDFVFPDGTMETNIQSGTNHVSNLKTIFDCDSIIETTLIVDPVYFNYEDVSICYKGEYTFPDGSVQTGIIMPLVYESILLSAEGCDSIIETNLMLETIDISVGQTEGSLIAYPEGMNYQWVDCNNNYSFIPDETSQTFSPYLSGTYAVIVDNGSCADTSACYSIIGSSTIDQTGNEIVIYPNPTKGKVLIKSENERIIGLRLINTFGQKSEIVDFTRIEYKSAEIDLSNQKQGIYFVEIITGKGTYIAKLIIQ